MSTSVVLSDNKIFSALFFPANVSPKRIQYPIHKKFWTLLNEDLPMVALLLKVLFLYLLYRVVKRVVLCLAPGLFAGTCWLDVISNLFRCKDTDSCPQPWCPMKECPF